MKLSRTSVSRTLQLRKKIKEHLLFEYAYEVLEGERFEDFVDYFHSLLPGSTSREYLRESLRAVAGVELTKDLLDETVWRIVGNLDLLAVQPVRPWTRQAAEESVPVQVLGARKDKPGYKTGWAFKLQILAGSPCPMVIEKFWTDKFCRFIASRLGFTYLKGQYPLYNPTEFTSLRFGAVIKRELSVGKPDFDEVEEWPSLIAHNRTVLKMRRRKGGFRCPANFTKECYLCQYGYDKCPAATHPTTYHFKYCDDCKQKSAFDPELNSPVCLSCFEKKIIKGES